MFPRLFQSPYAGTYEGFEAPYTGELDQGIIIAVILIVLFVAFITIKGMRKK